MDLANLDLKATINLPKTSFSMKANLPQAEPKMLARWEADDIYAQIRTKSAGRPRYVLHDGPPYANGHIHLGTAFNKIIKDFIVKSKTMAGFDSPYVPGWDCHGLPIEFKVDQELGGRKAKLSPLEIRAACRKYATKFFEAMRVEFKRLGVFGRWNDPYLTMSPEYQAVIAGAFVDFLDQGYVYKGLKPVNWCIFDRTALAEAEVEYEDHSSPSIWVRFALASDPAAIDPRLANHKVFGLIWTTTPWTIPANMAIAYHPKFEYSAVRVEDAVYIVATDLSCTNCTKLHMGEPANPRHLPRRARIEEAKAVFRHPFLDRDSLGILADHVTLEQGTGAVHTAPGHGQEDYVVGQQYGIATFCPVDAHGRFFHAEGASGTLPEELIGKTVWEGNPIVIEILKAHHALLALKKIAHSYPHCWRCHNPTIFRATDQWFIGMDRNGLRERALAAIKAIKWMPGWGEERISNMIATRPDWCISRQRVWGVPIVVFYCDKCREPLTDRKILDGVVDLIRLHNADVWYQRTAAELIPAGTTCAKCGSADFTKENDILDVWFDSGSSHLAVLTEKNDLASPGPPLSISKAATSTEAGSTARCSSEWAFVTARLIANAPPTAGLSTEKAVPCTNRSATTSRRKISSNTTARTCFASGPLRYPSRKTCACPRPSWTGSVRPTANCATPSATSSATCMASTPSRTSKSPRPTCRKSINGSWKKKRKKRKRKGGELDPGRRTGRPFPCLVQRFRVPQGLPCGLRLRDRRSEQRLLRCSEGPPLYLGHQIQSTPGAPPKRRCIASRTLWCGCSRPSWRSPAKKSGRISARRAASTRRCCPNRRILPPASTSMPGSRPKTGIVSWSFGPKC